MSFNPDLPNKPEEAPKKEPNSPDTQAHALEIFTKHRTYFESYAGLYGFQVRASPPSLGTFAIDLEKGILYIAVEWFTKRGYGEDEAVAYILHEIEHAREAQSAMEARGGVEQFKRRMERVKKSRRYGILDNCIDDVKVNRTVSLRAPKQDAVLKRFYEERFNQGSGDFTQAPKHLQFVYALLRKGMLPDQDIIVAPEVQDALAQVESRRLTSGARLMDIMTLPEIGMADRMFLQDKHLVPLYEKLFEQDKEERKQQEQDQGEPSGDPGDGEGQFSEDYDKFDEQNPDGALSPEEIEKAVDKAIPGGDAKAKGGTTKESAERAYAEASGVSVSDMRAYQEFYRQLSSLAGQEGERTALEELRELFERIVAERLRPQTVPKRPVSHGHRLVRPAEAHVSVRAGIQKPAVWETLERKELKGKLYGNLDITVVCDRSGSMAQGDGTKARHQRLAVGLVLEALAEFSQILQERSQVMSDELVVRTQVTSFGGDTLTTELKPLTQELTERDRVRVHRELGTTDGTTDDYVALDALGSGVSEDERSRMKQGELKKIVLVITDGESNDSGALKESIAKLRAQGAVVVGVGVGTDATSVTANYAPLGRLVQDPARLAGVLAEVLKEHLADVSTLRFS